MIRLFSGLVLVASIAVGYAAGQLVAPPVASSARDAAVTSSQATMVPLEPGDVALAAISDRADGAWVLARQERAASAVLYHVASAGQARIVLPVPSAGRLGGLAQDPTGAVWVGVGTRLVAVGDATGGILREITLPPAQHVASRAQRAPDGTVLGLGQVSTVAATADGVWVGRYAATELTFVDRVGNATAAALSQSVDAKTFTTDLAGTVWFTTNFGPSDQLGAFIGRIESATHAITLTPIVVASLAAGSGGIHALSREWRVLDGAGAVVASRPVPPQGDVTTTVITAKGELVLRGLRQAALHLYDKSGAEVRQIQYAAGSFIGYGGATLPSTARLAFLVATTRGRIWFAPEGSSFIYYFS